MEDLVLGELRYGLKVYWSKSLSNFLRTKLGEMCGATAARPWLYFVQTNLRLPASSKERKANEVFWRIFRRPLKFALAHG